MHDHLVMFVILWVNELATRLFVYTYLHYLHSHHEAIHLPSHPPNTEAHATVTNLYHHQPPPPLPVGGIATIHCWRENPRWWPGTQLVADNTEKTQRQRETAVKSSRAGTVSQAYKVRPRFPLLFTLIIYIIRFY